MRRRRPLLQLPQQTAPTCCSSITPSSRCDCHHSRTGECPSAFRLRGSCSSTRSQLCRMRSFGRSWRSNGRTIASVRSSSSSNNSSRVATNRTPARRHLPALPTIPQRRLRHPLATLHRLPLVSSKFPRATAARCHRLRLVPRYLPPPSRPLRSSVPSLHQPSRTNLLRPSSPNINSPSNIPTTTSTSTPRPRLRLPSRRLRCCAK